jgi:hypothetical protein
MKGYVAIPIRLPTGELTGYIGITEGKVLRSFTFPTWSHFPRRRLSTTESESRGFGAQRISQGSYQREG